MEFRGLFSAFWAPFFQSEIWIKTLSVKTTHKDKWVFSVFASFEPNYFLFEVRNELVFEIYILWNVVLEKLNFERVENQKEIFPFYRMLIEKFFFEYFSEKTLDSSIWLISNATLRVAVVSRLLTRLTESRYIRTNKKAETTFQSFRLTLLGLFSSENQFSF